MNDRDDRASVTLEEIAGSLLDQLAGSLSAQADTSAGDEEKSSDAVSGELPPDAAGDGTPSVDADVGGDVGDDDEPQEDAEDVRDESIDLKRLHAALKKERKAHRQVRRELKALRSELERLKVGSNAGAQAQPAIGSGPLDDCQTVEDVDRKVMTAAKAEADAVRLQRLLERHGADVVRQRLESLGVKEIDGRPVREADDELLADYLNRIYEGARLVQASADQRKRWLEQQAVSFQRAARIVPDLADPDSERAQMFARVVERFPWIRQAGPEWPELVATFLVGMEVLRKRGRDGQEDGAKAARKGPVLAPGVNRVGGAGGGKEYDALSSKLAKGEASLDDVRRLAFLGLMATEARR